MNYTREGRQRSAIAPSVGIRVGVTLFDSPKLPTMSPVSAFMVGLLVCALGLTGCGGSGGLPREDFASGSRLDVDFTHCAYTESADDDVLIDMRLVARGSARNTGDEARTVELDVEVVTAAETSFVMEGSVELELDPGERQSWEIDVTETGIRSPALTRASGDDEGYACAVFD